MRQSKVNTVTVPGIGQKNPATLYIADHVPMRVVVRNVGGSTIVLAHESPVLTMAQVIAGAYRLPPGQEDVFVLAPKQGLYAASAGNNGQVSYAASEAVPTYQMES